MEIWLDVAVGFTVAEGFGITAAMSTQQWRRNCRYVVHCYISVRVAVTGVQGLRLCAALASGDGEEGYAGVAGTRYQCLNKASVAPGPGFGVKWCSGRGDLRKSMHGKIAADDSDRDDGGKQDGGQAAGRVFK